MNCAEKDCSGNIDTARNIRVRGGYFYLAVDMCNPCNARGRLYKKNGEGILNRLGHRAFLWHGKIIYKPISQVNKK